jgi:phosphate starvation-inducible PhoH-like protein
MSKNWRELRDLDVMKRAEKQKIRPKTKNQETYWKLLHEKIVVICSGPAGTGKSLLAMSYAIEQLEQRKVERIVVTRPLVGCGNELGFLPGNVDEKSFPYMQSFFDILSEFFSDEEIEKMIEDGRLEVIPLELMRGLTLKNSIILLDESQNTKYNQLVMLLTRLGEGSQMVLVGDTSPAQIDIQLDWNPFDEVINRFSNKCHKSIGIIKMTEVDILRHPLIVWMAKRLYKENKKENKTCPRCQADL